MDDPRKRPTVADRIDTQMFRSHCQDWTANDDAVEQCFAIADEVDYLRAVNAAADKLVAAQKDELHGLRAAVRDDRDAAWSAAISRAYDDGLLNCDPWDIGPEEADRD